MRLALLLGPLLLLTGCAEVAALAADLARTDDEVQDLEARVAAMEAAMTDQAARSDAQDARTEALEAALDAASGDADARAAALEARVVTLEASVVALEASVAALGAGAPAGMAVESWQADGALGGSTSYGGDMVPVEVDGASMSFVPTHDGYALVNAVLQSYGSAPSSGYFPCQGWVQVRLTDAAGAYQESPARRMYAAYATDATVFEVVAGETYTAAWYYTVTDWYGSYTCTYQAYAFEALAFATE